MKIVICGSLKFTYEIKEVADQLQKLGHKVEIPWGAQKILAGKFDYDKFMKEKETKGDIKFRKNAEEDLIIRYYHKIKKANAILIANYDKGEVKNYIGGNSLIEMAFAHVFTKRIFLLNPIPSMSYSDEIKAMNPIILNGDLSKIK